MYADNMALPDIWLSHTAASAQLLLAAGRAAIDLISPSCPAHSNKPAGACGWFASRWELTEDTRTYMYYYSCHFNAPEKHKLCKLSDFCDAAFESEFFTDSANNFSDLFSLCP